MADSSAGVGYVERGENRVDARRAALHRFEKAGEAGARNEQPQLPHADVEPAAGKAERPRRHTERRHGPNRQPDKRVAPVGEAVAERPYPVGTRAGRRLQRGYRPPVVGKKGYQRKDRRYRKEKPACYVMFGLSVSGSSIAICHFLHAGGNLRTSLNGRL